MKLKAGKKTYTLKYGIRAYILFEKIADKPFSIDGITDWVLLAYAMLLAGTPDADITLDEFIDSVSEEELNKAIQYATKLMAVERQLGKEEDPDEVKKK